MLCVFEPASALSDVLETGEQFQFGAGHHALRDEVTHFSVIVDHQHSPTHSFAPQVILGNILAH